MRACVDNNIPVIVVRQINILRIAAKSKLENAHAGKTKIIAQCFDIGSDHTKIFSNYRRLTKRRFYRHEEFPSRRFDPTTALGSLVPTGNFPAGSKAAEVIDAR